MKKTYSYLVCVVVFLGCNNLHKGNVPDICSNNGFSQKVETLALDDEAKMKAMDGKFVEIEGVFHNNFEDVALYASGPFAAKKAVWLDFVSDVAKSDKGLEAINGQHVIITGKVNISRKGHLGAYMATLDSVFCIKMAK